MKPILSSAIRATAIAVFVASLAAWGPAARAVEPDAPEVKATVKKALDFLDKNTDDRLGARCLIGMAFLKNGADKNHKRVREAIDDCEKTKIGDLTIQLYSLGTAIVFLCEADPKAHRGTIQRYLDEILRRQKPEGGWGYLDRNLASGDISQTQYAVLGLWMAHKNGFQVPVTVVDKAANYLIRTQDPKGGWGYQGVDPGNFNRVTQNSITPSRATAALGSLLILGDMMQFSDSPEATPEKKLPDALVAVGKEPTGVKRKTTVDPKMFRRAITDGEKWMEKQFVLPQHEWTAYYMYSYERYRAFKELEVGQYEENAAWYNTGFDYLKKGQSGEGSWADQGGAAVDTAFGVLFLSRSSRKAIAKTGVDLGSGVLRGGMGLPPNTADIRENNGKLVETPLSGSVDELIALVEDEDNPEVSALVLSSQSITLDKDVTKRSGQIERLRSLVRAESADARLIAVRTLGQARDLNNVPMLLYALTDPDPRVVLEADKWLRFISRKVDGVGLEPGASTDQVSEAKRAWTRWYLSIRPDAELLE